MPQLQMRDLAKIDQVTSVADEGIVDLGDIEVEHWAKMSERRRKKLHNIFSKS